MEGKRDSSVETQEIVLGSACAALRALESRKPAGERLFFDPYAEGFTIPEAWQRAEEIMKERPGVELLSCLRTLYMDDYLRGCTREGAQQVVIFGAGFDSRALRLEELRAGGRVFEFDLPSLVAFKQRRLQEREGSLPGHVSYIGADLAQDGLEELKGRLREAGYDPGRRTAFVLEGIVTHIGEQGAENLLRLAASFSGEGSSLAMTYVHLNEQGVPLLDPTQTPTDRDYQRYGIEADRIEEFLEGRGFTEVCSLTIDQVRERYCPDRDKLEMAYSIVTARVKQGKGVDSAKTSGSSTMRSSANRSHPEADNEVQPKDRGRQEASV